MAEYTTDWFSGNIPIWETVLAELKGKPIRAVELGSFEGRSSVWLVENILTHPEARLDCVDTWKGSAEHDGIDFKEVEQRFLENTKPYGDKILGFKMTTTQYLTEAAPADLIYIDASHRAADVLTDAVLSHLILRPGGIIIFDDYMWAGGIHSPDTPRAAIDAFLECYAKEYTILGSGYQLILRKN